MCTMVKKRENVCTRACVIMCHCTRIFDFVSQNAYTPAGVIPLVLRSGLLCCARCGLTSSLKRRDPGRRNTDNRCLVYRCRLGVLFLVSQ